MTLFVGNCDLKQLTVITGTVKHCNTFDYKLVYLQARGRREWESEYILLCTGRGGVVDCREWKWLNTYCYV